MGGPFLQIARLKDWSDLAFFHVHPSWTAARNRFAIVVSLVMRVSKTQCDYCRLTKVVPDLGITGNREKWRLLEWAKHRVLYVVDSIGLVSRALRVDAIRGSFAEFQLGVGEDSH